MIIPSMKGYFISVIKNICNFKKYIVKITIFIENNINYTYN